MAEPGAPELPPETTEEPVDPFDEVEFYHRELPPPPTVRPKMFYGPHGEFALAAIDHTEAHEVALLSHAMVFWGVAQGPRTHFYQGGAEHPPLLWDVIVGTTAKSRKGTALAALRPLWFEHSIGRGLSSLDAARIRLRRVSGIRSGAALVQEFDEEKPLTPGGPTTKPSPNLVIVAPEMTGLVKAMHRPGDELSQNLREAWDRVSLENRTITRGRKVVMPDEHWIGMIGHCTQDEMSAELRIEDFTGGTVNRLQWTCSPDTEKYFSMGGNVPDALLEAYAKQLDDALGKLPPPSAHVRASWTPAAGKMWDEIYRESRSRDFNGLVAKASGRAEPYVMRNALNYATSVGSTVVDVEHLEAGIARWEYSYDTLLWLFGTRTGNERLDTLLVYLRRAEHLGLQVEDLKGLFGGAYTDVRNLAVREGYAVQGRRKIKTRPMELLWATEFAPRRKIGS